MMPELLEDWRAVGQLALLCQCGKAVELKRLGCCGPYYDRRQHSLRFFGGLRERVLKRDGGSNFKRRPCVSFPPAVTRAHADYAMRPLPLARTSLAVVPSLLVQLWTELHGEAPVQLPLFV